MINNKIEIDHTKNYRFYLAVRCLQLFPDDLEVLYESFYSIHICLIQIIIFIWISKERWRNALNHRIIKALVKPQPADTSTNPAQKRCITVSAKGKVGKWIKRMRSESGGERVVRQQTSHKSWAGVNVPSGCKSEPPLRYFSTAAFIISAIKLAALPTASHSAQLYGTSSRPVVLLPVWLMR